MSHDPFAFLTGFSQHEKDAVNSIFGLPIYMTETPKPDSAKLQARITGLEKDLKSARSNNQVYLDRIGELAKERDAARKAERDAKNDLAATQAELRQLKEQKSACAKKVGADTTCNGEPFLKLKGHYTGAEYEYVLKSSPDATEKSLQAQISELKTQLNQGHMGTVYGRPDEIKVIDSQTGGYLLYCRGSAAELKKLKTDLAQADNERSAAVQKALAVHVERDQARADLAAAKKAAEQKKSCNCLQNIRDVQYCGPRMVEIEMTPGAFYTCHKPGRVKVYF